MLQFLFTFLISVSWSVGIVILLFENWFIGCLLMLLGFGFTELYEKIVEG